ncbi:hypothetical protein L484_023051 [Morus notabilis]|uniref:Transmembrane protein n=1 Tax=Morus notabilis TaxID=981085 RepID=W9SAH8_9ROSA|nr:hypothetical protein L484_023051 [Morus notabilis]
MKSRSLIQAFNAISIIIFFFLLLSFSTHVEGSRLLKDHDIHRHFRVPSMKSFFLSQARSGPSNRGRGH